jgi:hypothetical protein
MRTSQKSDAAIQNHALERLAWRARLTALGLIGVSQIAFSLRRMRALVRVSHFRHAWAWSLGIDPCWDIRDRSSAAWPRNDSQNANLLRSSLRSIIRAVSRFLPRSRTCCRRKAISFGEALFVRMNCSKSSSTSWQPRGGSAGRGVTASTLLLSPEDDCALFNGVSMADTMAVGSCPWRPSELAGVSHSVGRSKAVSCSLGCHSWAFHPRLIANCSASRRLNCRNSAVAAARARRSFFRVFASLARLRFLRLDQNFRFEQSPLEPRPPAADGLPLRRFQAAMTALPSPGIVRSPQWKHSIQANPPGPSGFKAGGLLQQGHDRRSMASFSAARELVGTSLCICYVTTLAGGKNCAVVRRMWITEPDSSYWHRRAGRQRQAAGCTATFPADSAWDEEIMQFLRQRYGQTLRFMAVVNGVAGQHRFINNRLRVQAKLQIIKALGRLLREGGAQRVRRIFLVLPTPTEPVLPHLFAENSPISPGLTTLA